MTDRDAYLALSTFLPFGPVHLRHLLNYFETPQNVWRATKKQLQEIELKPQLIQKFLKHRQEFDLKKYKSELHDKQIKWITKFEDTYPANLKLLDDAPFTLYYKGEWLFQDKDAVAIVGTRKMTTYGRSVCQQFSEYLSSRGITIVSGLALGVDAIAHKSALEVSGRSIAVLASGLDTISPVMNKWIADKMVQNKLGVIMSEYPLNTPPAKSHFPHRTRLISGLSKAVLVVEGRIQSGTLHTAKHAADQGRSVFAIPGEVTSPMSEASHYLIRNGAVLADKPQSIIEDLDMQLRVDSEEVEKVLPTDEIEKVIFELLHAEPLHIDEIVRMSGLSISTVTTKLTMMELKGLIRQIDKGVYGK